ncbi:hypothetical protein CR513_55403, partial [Mucuna pruriens]
MTTNKIFLLYLNNAPRICLSTQLKDDAWLWHFRFGHLNFGGLKTFRQKEMVASLPNFQIPMKVCEKFVIGKQYREPFSKGNTQKAWKLLEVVHLDLYRSINPTSNGALTIFKNFKLMVEKEVGCPIQVCTQTVGENIPHVNLPNFVTYTTLNVN